MYIKILNVYHKKRRLVLKCCILHKSITIYRFIDTYNTYIRIYTIYIYIYLQPFYICHGAIHTYSGLLSSTRNGKLSCFSSHKPHPFIYTKKITVKKLSFRNQKCRTVCIYKYNSLVFIYRTKVEKI